MENELTHITENFKSAIRDREDLIAQLDQSEETCQGIKEELKSSRESCIELEVVKDQTKSQLLELMEALVGTKDQLNQQIKEKEKGLEKAEVNGLNCIDLNICGPQKNVHFLWTKKNSTYLDRKSDIE